MYRVHVIVSKPGYLKQHLEGFFDPPDPPLAVPDMKRLCVERIRRQLVERDPFFEDANVDITLFRQVRADFK